jgi:Tfp pilus assembly protein PilO
MSRVRLTLIAAIVAVLAIAAILWFFVLSPRMAEASQLTADAEQLQTVNVSLQHQYAESLKQAEEAPQAAAEAQALFAKMPQTAELPTVLDQITQAAVDAGIDPNAIPSLTTGIPLPVSGTANAATTEQSATGVQLAKMDIGVSADGTHEQVLTFLDNLQSLDRVLLVTSTQTSLAGLIDGTPDLETVQVSGSMFVLQSKLPDLVAEVDALIAQAELGQAGAGTATSDSSADTPAEDGGTSASG